MILVLMTNSTLIGSELVLNRVVFEELVDDEGNGLSKSEDNGSDLLVEYPKH